MTKIGQTPPQVFDHCELVGEQLIIPLARTSFIETPPVDLVKLVGEVKGAVWDASRNLFGYDLF